MDARVADVAGSGLGEHGGVSYAISQSSGLANLSEDPASGAGFYQLPKQCRTGSLYERRQRPVEYAGERSANGAAIATEAIAYDNDQGHFFGHGHGVFAPNDGGGAPFFAGYYD